MILEATHTHIYPGNRGKIFGLARIVDIQEGRDCVVAFSDGSAATATISRCESGWHLNIDAYRTAAGTNIPEKLWVIRLEEDGADVKFRIVNKVRKV